MRTAPEVRLHRGEMARLAALASSAATPARVARRARIVLRAADGATDRTIATELASDPQMIEAVAAGIEQANSHLARVEQIKRFTIIPGEWMPGGDELTPTMKLKRKPISNKYAAEIEAMYSASG